MYISKKDLLETTGISYGQLYRWKREKLIPDEWFNKQSSFTGQETFFPKDKILPRINKILELRSKYSLEEIGKMLAPEISGKLFDEEEISKISEINDVILSSFKIIKNSMAEEEKQSFFDYVEVVFMAAISQLYADNELIDDLSNLIHNIYQNLGKMSMTDYTLYLLKIEERHYMIITKQLAEVYLDDRFKVVDFVLLDDVSQKIRTKYASKFDLINT